MKKKPVNPEVEKLQRKLEKARRLADAHRRDAATWKNRHDNALQNMALVRADIVDYESLKKALSVVGLIAGGKEMLAISEILGANKPKVKSRD